MADSQITGELLYTWEIPNSNSSIKFYKIDDKYYKMTYNNNILSETKEITYEEFLNNKNDIESLKDTPNSDKDKPLINVPNNHNTYSSVVSMPNTSSSVISFPSFFDMKIATDWKDLDDVIYNNHIGNGQCYLKVEFNRMHSNNVDEKENTIFRYLPIYPEDVSFSVQTQYHDSSILGRPGTIGGYTNTGDPQIRFSMHLHRELEIPNNLTTDRNKIDEIIALMKACQYPRRYLDGLHVPIVTYVFGDTVIVGKQGSVNEKWFGPKIGQAYMECNIDVSVTAVPKGINYFDDIFTLNPRQTEKI